MRNGKITRLWKDRWLLDRPSKISPKEFALSILKDGSVAKFSGDCGLTAWTIQLRGHEVELMEVISITQQLLLHLVLQGLRIPEFG